MLRRMSDESAGLRLLTTTQVQKMLGIGKTAMYMLLTDPRAEFPAPIILGNPETGAPRYVASEVEAWIRSRPRRRGSKIE